MANTYGIDELCVHIALLMQDILVVSFLDALGLDLGNHTPQT